MPATQSPKSVLLPDVYKQFWNDLLAFFFSRMGFGQNVFIGSAFPNVMVCE